MLVLLVLYFKLKAVSLVEEHFLVRVELERGSGG